MSDRDDLGEYVSFLRSYTERFGPQRPINTLGASLRELVKAESPAPTLHSILSRYAAWSEPFVTSVASADDSRLRVRCAYHANRSFSVGRTVVRKMRRSDEAVVDFRGADALEPIRSYHAVRIDALGDVARTWNALFARAMTSTFAAAVGFWPPAFGLPFEFLGRMERDDVLDADDVDDLINPWDGYPVVWPTPATTGAAGSPATPHGAPLVRIVRTAGVRCSPGDYVVDGTVQNVGLVPCASVDLEVAFTSPGGATISTHLPLIQTPISQGKTEDFQARNPDPRIGGFTAVILRAS